ncbi:MAG: hypothetical protein AAF928_12570 [Myxococcota bacterium]
MVLVVGGRERRAGRMAAAVLVWLSGAVHAAGCDGSDAAPTSTSSVATTGAGGSTGTTGGPGACSQGGQPNGTCIPSGPAAETCDCPDCASAALCTGNCNDDGQCDFEGGEDCSCGDCFFRVADCSPQIGADDCDEEPGCQPGEACTCPDCTDTPFCRDNCFDNGECVPWFEGCACADCCNGGGPTSTTTTTTGGAGGAGGAPAGSGGSTAAAGGGGAGGA